MRCASYVTMLIGLAFATAACAPKRPALYDNQKSVAAGFAQVQIDIDECMALAKNAGHGANHGRDTAVSTAGGAAVGAGVGAATGAIRGNAGRGAARGAAGGAVAGLFRGMFRSRDPDPIERNYVDQCLRERGYQPIGWK
jgi:outer membrane lipoprotein SlyB